jgi:preprotein translocase subunit YajC
MISMLKKGDEVVTIGGMYGTVSAIGDDWVELEIAKRTRVRYLKRAISSITSIDEYDEDEEDEYIEAEDEVTEEADEEVATR